MAELPDWGKLLWQESPPKDLAAALPGAPPAAVALVGGLLQYDPARRLTAEAALRSPWFAEEPAPAEAAAVAAAVRAALA